MSKEMNNAALVVSGPVTKELAATRRSAVAALLTALKTKIRAKRIAFLAESGLAQKMEQQ